MEGENTTPDREDKDPNKEEQLPEVGLLYRAHGIHHACRPCRGALQVEQPRPQNAWVHHENRSCIRQRGMGQTEEDQFLPGRLQLCCSKGSPVQLNACSLCCVVNTYHTHPLHPIHLGPSPCPSSPLGWERGLSMGPRRWVPIPPCPG